MAINNKVNINNASSGGTLTSWVQYTPTFTGYGTVTSINFWSRRVGDCLEIRGTWTSGTPTATEARITIGYNGTSANVSSDTTIIPNINVCGIQLTGFSLAYSINCLIESGLTYMTHGRTISKDNGNANYGASSTGSLWAKIPVTTWP